VIFSIGVCFYILLRINEGLCSYLFLELALVPLIFTLATLSRTKEVLSASLYLVLYGVFFSLFLVLDLYFGLRYALNYLFLGGLRVRVLTFYAKLPIYGFHHWLPKAHVECVAWGSAILARILLKFRSYAILRHKIFFFLGRVLCLKCLYDMWHTSDFKVWVAYSSISHITLVFSGFILFYEMSYIYYFGPHTLLSSLMFFYYSKDYYYLGSWNYFYFSTALYFYFSIIWCRIPLYVNFLPELMILLSFFKLNLLCVLFYFANFVIFFFVLCKFSWGSLMSCSSGIGYFRLSYFFYGLSLLQFWLFI